MDAGQGSFHMELGKQYRRCRRCRQTKAVEDFYPYGATRKRYSECKDCTRARTRRNYRNRPVGRSREYEWKKRGILGKNGNYLKYPEFVDMVKSQSDQCAICGIEQSVDDFIPDHDHDHDDSPGPVRGILCASCNLALGKMNHSPDLLRRAADYLDSHQP